MQIICLTSNDYAHMTGPFAYLFRMFWSESTPVTVVRYDVPPPKLGVNFIQTAIGMQKDFTWSSGLKHWLLDQGPEMFILMLEDYWLCEKVDQERVEKAWEYMQYHPEAGKIDISGDLLNREHEHCETWEGIELEIAGENTQFQTSIQAAIWQKDFMVDLLKESETAWEFEKNGGGRLQQRRLFGVDDRLVLGITPGAVKYVNACGGMGNLPGKYDHKRIPGWMWLELLAKGLVRQ